MTTNKDKFNKFNGRFKKRLNILQTIRIIILIINISYKATNKNL